MVAIMRPATWQACEVVPICLPMLTFINTEDLFKGNPESTKATQHFTWPMAPAELQDP